MFIFIINLYNLIVQKCVTKKHKLKNGCSEIRVSSSTKGSEPCSWRRRRGSLGKNMDQVNTNNESCIFDNCSLIRNLDLSCKILPRSITGLKSKYELSLIFIPLFFLSHFSRGKVWKSSPFFSAFLNQENF